MEGEERNEDMRIMVERKMKLVQSQEAKLSIISRRKLNMLNSLFTKNKRLKCDTLNQALDEIRKLASEISTTTDLEEKRASLSSNNITMRRQSTNLRVVLTRVGVDDLPISKRTRSKSIDVRPEWTVSYTSDTETDKDTENDRPGVKQAVKRGHSKSAVQQQQTNCTADFASTTITPELKKRKSIGSKAPTPQKKVPKSRSKGPGPVNHQKRYKRNVLYDSDTEDHVAEASTRVPCNRAELKPIIKVYPDIPNDNPDRHCRSNFMEKCCLCRYRGVNMVEHYVSKHPQQEVFVSRISPQQSSMIRKCPMPKHASQRVVPASEAIHRFCHFCQKGQHLTVTEWIKHVAEHTGEYELYGTEKKPHKEICFRNNHILAYLCDRCNYVQTRLSSIEQHLEKQHPSNHNEALKNIEYVRFSVVEKRCTVSNSSNANSIITTNANIGMKKDIMLRENQPMQADTNETGYDSSCSSGTISMLAADDEAITISMKPSKSPPLPHFGSENDQVSACLESIYAGREHSNDSAPIHPIVPCVPRVSSMPSVSSVSSVASVARVPINPITPIMPVAPIVANDKKKYINESIMQVETNEEELVVRAQPECREQQQSNATLQKQSRENQYAYSRPISVVISERTMNHEDSNGNGLGNYWCEKKVNGIPKPWIPGSSQKMIFYYHSMLKTESLVAFYKCMAHACDFTTQNDKAMEHHLFYHEFSKSLQSEDMQWLECCYCAFFANGPKELVKHLQSVHGDCGYQCNRCFYRSREASALAVHQLFFHSDSEEHNNRIFQCTKRVKNYCSSDQGLIIKNMVKTVPLLVCNACPSGKFYGLLSFKDHIESHKFNFMTCYLCRNMCGKMELMNHLQNIHGIYLFQCVYCQFGTVNTGWIEHHVSVHHPENIFCYHVRNARQTLEPYVRPRKVIPSHRVVVFSSA